MPRRLRLGGILAVALSLIGAGAVAAPVAADGRVRITGNTPAWATPDRDRGRAGAGQSIDISVYLSERDAPAARRLATQVSDPGSPLRGRYLTPSQFRARFAPTTAQVGAVRSWLQSEGLQIGEVPDNNHYVAARGTVAQVETAFGTELHNYQVGQGYLRAPATDLTVPTSLGGTVAAIAGLDEAGMAHPATRIAPPPAFMNAPPCSRFWSDKLALDVPPLGGRYQPLVPCGYTPAQLQGAYGLDRAIASKLDGSGATVAITDAYAAPTLLKDANTYAGLHGQAPFAPGQFVRAKAPHFRLEQSCSASGWSGEQALDVEAVHAIAPGARVVYVPAASCSDQDLDAALNQIVDHHLAQIVTNSWGNVGEDVPPAVLTAYERTFVQAILEGIGVFFSSGDEGDELAATGIRQVDYPASDPLVTAVGGTSLAVGAQNNYLFETGWGTAKDPLSGGTWSLPPPGPFIYGGGGGTSRLFAQPPYQAGVVPPSLSGYFGGSGRTVPDIAAVADPNTGMLIGLTQAFPGGAAKYSEYRIGGTSLASPVMAGIEAIADQAAGKPHGFANFAIYSLAGTSAFHDVVAPATSVAVVRHDFADQVDAAQGTLTSLRTMNQTGTLRAAPGYDDVTGVGTPNGPDYIRMLPPP